MLVRNATSRQYLGSLRRRYLFFATIVALVLLVGAIVTDWHTRKIAKSNTASLELRVHTNKALSMVRSSLRRVDITLATLLITPEPEHEKIIFDNIDLAMHEVGSLLVHLRVNNPNLAAETTRLLKKLSTFKQYTRYLVNKRNDPTWVFPIIAYTNEKMLVANNDFENSATIVLHAISEEDGRTYASTRYGKFDTLRDLWRLKILNFRLLLVRFAGLGYVDKSPQEENISDIHISIERLLDDLDVDMQKGVLSFDEELALEAMQQASTDWHQSWQAVKAFRAKKVWRNDTEYIKTDIRPLQQEINESLLQLDNELLSMSSENVSLVQDTTDIITRELWAFFVLSLFFVIGIYWMIDRSILRPIEKIAKALSAEGLQKEYSLGKQDSQEIRQLVNAFRTMRGQIHQRQEELQNQALHDALTGLPNRTLFKDRLEHGIKEAHRTGQHMSVLLLDLDRFKDVNDALGHQVGDKLLQHVAKRIDNLIRESDTVARLGGDEFAIVAPATDTKSAEQFAEKIVAAINEVFCIDSQNLYVGVSIGISVYPKDGEDATTLTRHSDVAMYEAKREGKGFSVYVESQDKSNTEYILLVESLHKELEQTRFLTLHYQPQINVATGELTGVEALLRWAHPELGMIPPESIIELAERAGQINALTDWIIQTAFRECTSHIDMAKLRFSINLSVKNLQDDELPLRIADLMVRYGIAPSSLTLEITESAVMSHPLKARETMNQLADMNIKMSVDDYGTGFSSLGYLKMLPVSELKIDKSFVINMLEDINDEIIVRSTVELAHNLGLQVVAEGVENQEILARLRNLKCDTAQGYYISRPMSKHDFCIWLEDYNLKAVNS